MTTTTTAVHGGAWLTEDAAAASILTPERLGDEHRMIAQTAIDFVDGEVLPVLDRLEAKDWALARTLLKRSGDLGLLGTDVPESLGGVDLDKAASVLVGEAMGRCASFGTTFGSQTGLVITPLLWFGSDDQKRRYLPGLVSGEMVGAYALSESGSGSDALNAKARAVRQDDGSFLVTGEKMWISNGGFADLFVVFAKVYDGATGAGQFTAFLVERGYAGVSTGSEEHKMGLHGSSTTPLILQDARVPPENVLGEIGKGHKVAFNVLNYGRFKLGAMCSGGARRIIGQAAAYAVERRQFGQPIASFGAVKHKLAEMVIREYAVEAMLYRTAGLIDAALDGSKDSAAVLAALEELAIEASILKVASSEMIDFAVDENVQIHGGNGFVRDYPAERQYRDARVNRIFEGTNEINRLLIPGMLAKRAVKGTLPIIPAARALQDELLSPSFEAPGDGPLDAARQAVTGMKKTALMVLGTAMQTFGSRLSEEQEVLTRCADVIIDVYAAESVLLRATAANTPLHAAVAQVFVNDAVGRVEIGARDALAAMAEGDALRVLTAALRRLLKMTPVNTVARRRTIEAALTERRGYPF
jgi:alkylation response protein AidB-like acyl-CoA dehydrogenase